MRIVWFEEQKKKIMTPRRFELLHLTIVETPVRTEEESLSILESTALDQLGHSAI